MLSSDFIEALWYKKRHPLSFVLVPFGWLYQIVMMVRYQLYQSGLLPVQRAPVPVIIVGNISVGGTGKTPLVIWLANYLKQQGFNPGIVSRGYGGAAKKWPQQVRSDSDPTMVGDEPVLIARKTGCPVAASPQRYAAIEGLVQHPKCDIVICDDGLQHHGLARDIEIAVIDGLRRHGNQRCLPAGPLREPPGRLKTIDIVVSNGLPEKGEHTMEYSPQQCILLINENQQCNIDDFKGKTIHAVAGTGHPARFFSMLRKLGLNIIEHKFPDHYSYKA